MDDEINPNWLFPLGYNVNDFFNFKFAAEKQKSTTSQHKFNFNYGHSVKFKIVFCCCSGMKKLFLCGVHHGAV